jgi:hypothetical protein
MVEIVLGVAVFVLAVAVVGLFAMMGELTSRIPEPESLPDLHRLVHPSTLDSPPEPHSIPEALLDAAPAEWPAELAVVRDAELAHVLVFGSTCVTCGRIANGETGPLNVLPPPLAVVISCPLPKDGAEFLAKHPLVTDYPHLVDVGGTWLSSNFGVGISPSLLVFARGRLQSAHTFVAATALSHLSAAANS